jgi:hypothetical protein
MAAPAAVAAPDDAAQARNLAQEGGDLLDAKRYAEALDRLKRAEALYHAPTNVLMIGQAEEGLGHFAAALTVYERLAAEPIPGSAPRPFLEALQGAKQRIRALLARVPSLLIVVRGLAAGEQAEVRVDGQPFTGDLATAVRLDPGDHVVSLDVPGHPHKEQRVTLPEKGGVVEVQLSVAATGETALPPPPQPTATPTVEHETVVVPPSHEGGSIVPAMVFYGVGVAGIATGAVAGAISLGNVGDLRNRCASNHCTSAQQSEIDSTKTLGWVSTIGFGVGAAGAVTGTVLLLLRGHGSEKAAAVHGPRIEPFVGWNAAGLEGTF